ncbi:hypothetical protein ADUPG1_002434, partial [Aduncisulcus paluster]
HSSPARIRSMNLNWLGPIMSILRLGLVLKRQDGIFSLIRPGTRFSATTRSTFLLRKRIAAINHAEWVARISGRCAPYLKMHPTSVTTFNRSTPLVTSLILMRAHLSNVKGNKRFGDRSCPFCDETSESQNHALGGCHPYMDLYRKRHHAVRDEVIKSTRKVFPGLSIRPEVTADGLLRPDIVVEGSQNVYIEVTITYGDA